MKTNTQRSDSKRTIEYLVEVIRKMPYQFTLTETERFISLLNERLDEILEIHKAENDIKQGLNYADEDTLMPAT